MNEVYNRVWDILSDHGSRFFPGDRFIYRGKEVEILDVNQGIRSGRLSYRQVGSKKANVIIADRFERSAIPMGAILPRLVKEEGFAVRDQRLQLDRDRLERKRMIYRFNKDPEGYTG